MLLEFDKPEDVLSIASTATIIMGEPGCGKSTEAAKAFQDALFVLSGKTNLRNYQAYLLELVKWAQTTGKPIPAYKPYQELPVMAMPPMAAPHELFNPAMATNSCHSMAFMNKVITGIEAEAKLPPDKRRYKGVVIDEWSIIIDRICEESRQATQTTKGNMFEHINFVKYLSEWVLTLPRRTDFYLVLICHEDSMKFHMPQDKKVPDQLRGMMKQKGGPKLPISTMQYDSAALVDFMFQFDKSYNRGPGAKGFKVKIKTRSDEEMLRKERDLRLPDEIELAAPDEMDLTATNLRSTLEKIGAIVPLDLLSVNVK